MSHADRDRIRFVIGMIYANRVQAFRKLPEGASAVSDLVAIVQEFERDGFDAFFMPDFLGLNRSQLEKGPARQYEPLTFLGAVALATSRIGLVGTGSAMLEYPYNLARHFASLDNLSGGRAGWNAVTSFNGEKNYGFDTIPTPEERYEIGAEFIEVVQSLWSSWHPGSIVTDATGTERVNSDLVVDIGHRGKHFAVAEALDIAPSQQGRPVIFQAGASDAGIEFAGRFAEAVFVATPTIEHGKTFYRKIKDAVIRHGRDPNSLKVFPGVQVNIGRTLEEAQAKYHLEVTDETIAAVKKKLQYEFPELDLEGLDLGQPIPPERLPDPDVVANAGRRRSRIALLVDIAARPGTTFGEFVAVVSRSFGHLVLVGTADSVADDIARWYAEDACDGFVVMGSGDSYAEFVGEVLPRLRERGIWWPPTDATLRENLGVGDPYERQAEAGENSPGEAAFLPA